MSNRILAFFTLILALMFALTLTSWAQSAQTKKLQLVNTGWQNAYGQYPAYGQPSRLSPDDQQKFDKYYQKWVDASRRNDRDDIDSNARHMQDIMARYNIPPSVPFAQIASNPGNNGVYAQPGVYGYSGQRLSPDDQRKFDDYYRKWLDASRKNDRDDIENNAKHMQEIMGHYNIPPTVPFDQIATNGTAAYGYSGMPNGAYGYSGQRLSPNDQKKFDDYYRKWVDARRKNDRDDIDKNARRMQDIMAHYNIPANVPFDQIASVAVNR